MPAKAPDRGAPVRVAEGNAYRSFALDQPRAIMIDPEVAFGQPVLQGSGIPTRIIGQRFDAGDPIEHLALDYDRAPQEIQEAIRWERRAA